jgi:hypothetical protein
MFGGTVGRHDVPHRAAGRQRRRRSAKTTANAQRRRQLRHPRHQDLHLGGDHDLAENIVHLVLARVDGAPAGTKGLTLFIVPKIRVVEDGTLGELNDVSVGNIEHKMGINGSATCVLNFGETASASAGPSAATRSSTRA